MRPERSPEELQGDRAWRTGEPDAPPLPTPPRWPPSRPAHPGAGDGWCEETRGSWPQRPRARGVGSPRRPPASQRCPPGQPDREPLCVGRGPAGPGGHAGAGDPPRYANTPDGGPPPDRAPPQRGPGNQQRIEANGLHPSQLTAEGLKPRRVAPEGGSGCPVRKGERTALRPPGSCADPGNGFECPRGPCARDSASYRGSSRVPWRSR